MLMYHLYIPLSQPFSPCLALARESVNTLLVVAVCSAIAVQYIAANEAIAYARVFKY